jgi:hypothetical protein
MQNYFLVLMFIIFTELETKKNSSPLLIILLSFEYSKVPIFHL